MFFLKRICSLAFIKNQKKRDTINKVYANFFCSLGLIKNLSGRFGAASLFGRTKKTLSHSGPAL
jgi:hypothetical protein